MSKAKIIEKAIVDPYFRQKLKDNPAGLCRAEGVELPVNATVQIIEKRRNDIHFFVGEKTSSPEINAILERAEKNPVFCNELCEDPHSVLTELAGFQIAKDVKVIVHNATDSKYYIVLPEPTNGSPELSESELATVSGGGLLKNIVNRICGDSTVVIIGKDGAVSSYTDPSIGTGVMNFGNVNAW